MTHLSDAVLAEYALGQRTELTAEEEQHLTGCADCRATATRLDQVLGDLAEPVEMSAPSAGVWSRIRSEVDADGTRAASVPAADSAPPTDSGPPAELPAGSTGRRRTRRGMILVGVVAAAVGLIIGVIGGLGITDLGDRPRVITSTDLTALPDRTGGGTAQVVEVDDRRELRIRVDAPSRPDAYREVWLLNQDGTLVQSIGVLPADGVGDYPLPASVQDRLRDYTVVDVSLEPYDGDARHSGDSLVRGELPG